MAILATPGMTDKHYDPLSVLFFLFSFFLQGAIKRDLCFCAKKAGGGGGGGERE